MNNRVKIPLNVQRKLYAESMGKCMNPKCQVDLFSGDGVIAEMAHIDPYCETENNSFDNLVLLCPNCHTNFDNNNAFTVEDVKTWKKIRKTEIDSFFSRKFPNFEELKKQVVPLLQENKSIYENYYQGSTNDFFDACKSIVCRRKMWEKFEAKILVNNAKLSKLLSANLDLFQKNNWCENDSNLYHVNQFLLHLKEFELTRGDKEKDRVVLFPQEINSIFGVSPIEGSIMGNAEYLERLIKALKHEGKFHSLVLGTEQPYILIRYGDETELTYLNDSPKLRQICYGYGCFTKKAGLNLPSLNFALKYIRDRGLEFKFLHDDNLGEIVVCNRKIVFVYKYCLNEVFLCQLNPDKGSFIVNLHNWNGSSCISDSARNLADEMQVRLLTMKEFYLFIRNIQNNR